MGKRAEELFKRLNTAKGIFSRIKVFFLNTFDPSAPSAVQKRKLSPLFFHELPKVTIETSFDDLTVIYIDEVGQRTVFLRPYSN